jgi:leucyl aminopeptidase
MPLELAVRSADPSVVKAPLLALLLPPGNALPTGLKRLDAFLGGSITAVLKRGDFRGNRDETLHLTGISGGAHRVLLVGIGKTTPLAPALRRAGAVASRQAHKLGVGQMSVWTPRIDKTGAEALGVGLNLGCWEYIDLRQPPASEERRTALTGATIVSSAASGLRNAVAAASAIGSGYDLTRRLAMMPGNLCTPDHLATTAREIGKRHRMTVTALGRKEMEKLGMGSFLAVAQGTPQEPRLVAMEHRKGPKNAKPIVLVGKGLCFDTGGISIKPAERMEFMKFDMCGAAAVLGAMEAIGRLNLRVNVVGVFGATTNMPSGTAVKPGDVVVASTGKSIEIINTDAEGRLVLADVLAWVKRFDPAAVIDAATLTGAVVIALGNSTTGALGNDEKLMREVLSAATTAGEPAWQLPLGDEYRELIKSDVADIKNSGGRAAGAISAAWFLREFADFPWVHLDVAGTAYSETDLVMIPRGPTGVPMGTFVQFVRGRTR